MNSYYESGFNDELEKIAKLTIDDIEFPIGEYLTDEQEEYARPLIEEQNAKRFALRHPFLTGLPTLGIWPLIAEGRATNEVLRPMTKKFPELNEKIRQLNIAYNAGYNGASEAATMGAISNLAAASILANR